MGPLVIKDLLLMFFPDWVVLVPLLDLNPKVTSAFHENQEIALPIFRVLESTNIHPLDMGKTLKLLERTKENVSHLGWLRHGLFRLFNRLTEPGAWLLQRLWQRIRPGVCLGLGQLCGMWLTIVKSLLLYHLLFVFWYSCLLVQDKDFLFSIFPPMVCMASYFPYVYCHGVCEISY